MTPYDLIDALTKVEGERKRRDSSPLLRALDTRLNFLVSLGTGATRLNPRFDGALRSALASELRDARRLRVSELANIRRAEGTRTNELLK